MPRFIPVLLLAALVTPSASADQLPEAAARVVDYRISVTLDPVAKTLTGRQHILWRNPSEDEVPDLWFHLYLNAFRNTESTFYRESGGQLRGDRMTDSSWGWTDVTAMRLADGTDLLGEPWIADISVGSPRQYKHRLKREVVSVAGPPSLDLPPGTLKSILKQAGLKREAP